MTDAEPTFGVLPNQQYTPAQIARVARDAAPQIRAEPGRDAGKVYCPCCRLREARWKRHYDEAEPNLVHLFVYCTQCHKTGVADVDLNARRGIGCLLFAVALPCAGKVVAAFA